jgi:chromosome partition protein MukE
MSDNFETLQQVIESDTFARVDIALRAGRHVHREDVEHYGFLQEALPLLEAFYARFGCQLIRAEDGYFFLLPTSELLPRRQLTAGEMLVGQTLALLYLDPAALASNGVITRKHLMERLVSLVGERELVSALNPRRRANDNERVVQENTRKEVSKALRGLAALGFAELMPDEQIRLRPPLTRFMEPVRGVEDQAGVLSRLIAAGRIVGESDEESEDDE